MKRIALYERMARMDLQHEPDVPALCSKAVSDPIMRDVLPADTYLSMLSEYMSSNALNG